MEKNINVIDPILTGVRINIAVGSNGGDNLDSTSKVDYSLYHIVNGGWAHIFLCTVQGALNENERRHFDMTIHDNQFPKSQMNDTHFYMNFTSTAGNDKFYGSIILDFIFSDGTLLNFNYGEFGIGNQNLARDTQKPVHI